MVLIDTLKDIEGSALDERVKFYLRKRFAVLSQSLKTDNLSCFGSIIVIEGFKDVDRLKEIGITASSSKIVFENVSQIHIFNSRDEYIILLGCVVLNNDFAVDVICIKGLCNRELEANMLSNINNEEYLLFSQE